MATGNENPQHRPSPTARHGRLFVTGTDTGVGKTVLSALWVHHLRQAGVPVVGLKPFCSGPRSDVAVLHRLQAGALAADAINPFWYRQPLAPGVAARCEGGGVTLRQAVSAAARGIPAHAWAVIEGCGGLMTPLGEKYTNADLAKALGARVVLVGVNRLGVINAVLLALGELKRRAIACVAIVIMQAARPDASAASNGAAVRSWAEGIPVLILPHLGRYPTAPEKFSKNYLRCRGDLETLTALAGVEVKERRRGRAKK